MSDWVLYNTYTSISSTMYAIVITLVLHSFNPQLSLILLGVLGVILFISINIIGGKLSESLYICNPSTRERIQTWGWLIFYSGFFPSFLLVILSLWGVVKL